MRMVCIIADGDAVYLNVSTKAHETKIYKGLVQDLIDSKELDEVGEYDAKLLLEKKYLLYDDQDFHDFLDLHTNIYFNSENRPTSVSDEWPKGLVKDING